MEDSQLAIYERQTLYIKLFHLDLQNENEEERIKPQGENDVDVLGWFQEIHEQELFIDKYDIIEELRWSATEQFKFYIFLQRREVPSFFEIDVESQTCNIEKLTFKYNEKGILKLR